VIDWLPENHASLKESSKNLLKFVGGIESVGRTARVTVGCKGVKGKFEVVGIGTSRAFGKS
jgi:hypothetical protein